MASTLLNDDDITTEVLSRLPAKTLLQFKCVCKKWKSLISDPYFLQLHYQRRKDITGVFLQESLPYMDMDIETVNYISVDKKPSTVQGTILDFLPEKVVIVASCNDLLCCRSCINIDESNKGNKTSPHYLSSVKKEDNFTKELVVYICNPGTKEWISLRPDDGCHVGEGYGLACYPFSSSSDSNPSFKLVKIRRLRSIQIMYSFVIYSSETKSWRTSKETCKFNSKFFANRMIFVNGRFHWLTWNHHIITFDVEWELSQVIKLPGPVFSDKWQTCIGLGESEGCFHYVCAYALELQVWILKNYDEPEWVLKYSLPLKEFCQEHSSIFDTSMVLSYAKTDHHENRYNLYLKPLVFYNEVLFMETGRSLLSYDFKSRTLVNYCSTKQLGDCFPHHPTVLPYSFSLVSLYNFKEAAASRLNEKEDRIQGKDSKKTN